MAYFNFRNGFSIQTSSAIDKRLLLTKAEMLTAEDDFILPSKYFCLCIDDGKFYIYDSTNEADATTGKYRVIDETIAFTTSAAKQAIADAIEASATITTMKSDVADLKQGAIDLDGRLDTVEGVLEDLDLDSLPGTVDGGDVTSE